MVRRPTHSQKASKPASKQLATGHTFYPPLKRERRLKDEKNNVLPEHHHHHQSTNSLYFCLAGGGGSETFHSAFLV